MTVRQENIDVPMRKIGYHHGNLRVALVEAGLARLRSNLGGEPSLRELARDVGVSANAAYRHFPDKGAVLAALAAEGFRRFNKAQVAAALSEREPLGAILALGRAYVAFAQRNPALFRLMFGCVARDSSDESLRAASQAAFRTFLSHIAALLSLPVDDARVTLAATRVWVVVHGLSHLQLDCQPDCFEFDPQGFVNATLRSELRSCSAIAGEPRPVREQA